MASSERRQEQVPLLGLSVAGIEAAQPQKQRPPHDTRSDDPGSCTPPSTRATSRASGPDRAAGRSWRKDNPLVGIDHVTVRLVHQGAAATSCRAVWGASKSPGRTTATKSPPAASRAAPKVAVPAPVRGGDGHGQARVGAPQSGGPSALIGPRLRPGEPRHKAANGGSSVAGGCRRYRPGGGGASASARGRIKVIIGRRAGRL